MRTHAFSRFAHEFLAEASPALERFYGEFNAQLASLVHPGTRDEHEIVPGRPCAHRARFVCAAFVWHASEHAIRKLNETEKEARRVWEERAENAILRGKANRRKQVVELARESARWLQNATRINRTDAPKTREGETC